MGKLTIEYVSIDEIKPYDNNPRRNLHAVAEVRESIRKYGWRQPIVVDSDGVIVVGHTRYLAAVELGEDTVPVHVAEDMTEEEIKAYRIVDNAAGEVSTWDFDRLVLEMGEMDVEGGTWDRLDAVIEEFMSKPAGAGAQLETAFTGNIGEAGGAGNAGNAGNDGSQSKPEDEPEELLDMRGHSFYDGADGGDEKTTSITHMTIGKKTVPLSREEEERLLAVLKKHGDIYGSYFGFVNRLLKGEYKDV